MAMGCVSRNRTALSRRRTQRLPVMMGGADNDERDHADVQREHRFGRYLVRRR